MIKNRNRIKKKIIHWSFVFFPHLGGISTHIDSIVKNMPEYDFEVITNHVPGTELLERYSENTIIKRFKPENYYLYPSKWMKRKLSIPCAVFSEILRTYRQKKYFKKTEFDILHLHETDKNTFYLDLLFNTNFFLKISNKIYNISKLQKPKLLTKHFMYAKGNLHPKFEEWEQNSFNGFDNIIFPTKWGYEKYIKYFEMTNQKKNVWYIPNSVDTDLFKFAALNNSQKLKVGCVARLSPEKGENFLIQFLNIIPDFVEFYWACSGRQDRIESLKATFNKPNVHIYPNLDYNEIPDFYHNFDILLNSTMVISNDRVIPEAMSCGRPVIAIDTGENCHILPDKTGFLIQPDVKELISLLTYINADRKKLTDMGRNARVLIESRYSNNVIIPQIKNVYEQIKE